MVQVCTINEESLEKAAAIIREGGVIVVPTDTVYGVACDPTNPQAVEQIYALKRRSHTKALQILLHDLHQLDQLGLYLPSPLDVLATHFLPGGYSPIACEQPSRNLAADTPIVCTMRVDEEGRKTQAVRIPDCPELMQILQATGPLAASSANRSGNESANCVEEAVAAFGEEIPLYLDAGPTRSHVASTVVAADTSQEDGIVVLREGVIAADQLRSVLRG